MDINFRIIWVEDVDEWYDSLSRRLTRYITSKNFKIDLKRVRGVKEFDINQYQMKNIDLLVVDYELENEIVDGKDQKTYGYEVINKIRNSNFVNDVLFYSSHGFNSISDVLKNEGLQGVFITDRNSKDFMNMAEALVDKAVRRSENLVNIRGIVMDNTSEFDNAIRDIISLIWGHLKVQEKDVVKYINEELLNNYKKTADKFVDKYQVIDKNNIDNLLNERSFTAFMQARLLGKCINANEEVKSLFYDVFKKFFKSEYIINEELPFFIKYDSEIIKYRNTLAHVKRSVDSNGEVFIGKIDGNDIVFNEALCNLLRENIMKYESLLEDMYSVLENQ